MFNALVYSALTQFCLRRYVTIAPYIRDVKLLADTKYRSTMVLAILSEEESHSPRVVVSMYPSALFGTLVAFQG